MDRIVFFDFIKDRRSFSFAYFAACTLLILFFRLSTAGQSEIVYPASITIFIYVFFMAFEFFKHYRFNARLSQCIENEFYSLPASTCEQKEVCRVLNGIHDRYTKQIGSLKAGEEEYRRFLSQWIHEIKTPVSVIDLIMQKCRHGGMEVQKALERIGEENRRITGLAENILDMMRLEEFSKDYMPSTIDLAASVKRVINKRKNQFIYSNVFPIFQCESEAVYVLSDSKWNDVMIDQFVSNAVKYSKTDEGSKKVFISIEQQGDRVSVVIKDQGVGIPPHDLKKVFEPFFTGENGRRCANSTGIGLYMCSVIAKKLGHKILIDSAVDIGTSVRVEYLSKM